MAATRKPAAKPAAKKAPVRRTRKPAEPTVETQPASTPDYTPQQKAAKVEAYHVLTSAGLPVPADLEAEVTAWVAEQQAAIARQQEQAAQAEQAQQEQIAAANLNGPWYVRNVTYSEFNLRLDRQTEKRRVQLKPRGNPGDMHPLKDEDLEDPILKRNLALGIIEIIPAGEANLVMEKQTHNAGPRVHPALALLRNEKGEAYAQGAVKVEAEFNSQGITVATLDPRIMQGQVHDREITSTRSFGGLQRTNGNEPIVTQQQSMQPASSVVHSQFIPTGGAPASIQFSGMDQNAQAKAIDDLARRKNLSGPAAGLGQVQVVVDPVVRT